MPVGSVDTGHRFLARCQVDTPYQVVAQTWQVVHRYRDRFGLVADFGCGDGRFASMGHFDRYIGYEIDPARLARLEARHGFDAVAGCAFDFAHCQQFDLCIGNPPYVRHHDLMPHWRAKADRVLASLLPYSADGRANAYVYFVWLALGVTKSDGLVTLILPREWLTRPAARRLRDYIKDKGWNVDVYPLPDDTFHRVLTTSAIAVVDKAARSGRWRVHRVTSNGTSPSLRRALRSRPRLLKYDRPGPMAYAQRGLSPGNQKAFLLTEGQRIHFGLVAGRDVVPAVSSFRWLSSDQRALTQSLFQREYVGGGRRCWLIKPPLRASDALRGYLRQVPKSLRSTATCTVRRVWWLFTMPVVPKLLYSSGFVGAAPKAYLNEVRAVHVGVVQGIFCRSGRQANNILNAIRRASFTPRVVQLSGGFRKIEVRQMNSFLNGLTRGDSRAEPAR